MYMDHKSPPRHEGGQPSDIEHDAHVLAAAYLSEPAPVYRRAHLPQPLCLPQISGTFDAPFARGFSPVLYDIGISQETFLKFVDGLNMAIIASPPLQVVNAAGTILSFIPTPTAMAVGAALQITAQTGTHVLSKSVTDGYLRTANENLFEPLHLRARLCQTPAMRVLVGLADPNAPKRSKMANFGKGVGEVVLKLPAFRISKRIVHAVMDAPPHVDPRETNPLVRRMQQLQGYTLPVTFEVPRPARPEGVMGMMNGYAVRTRLDKEDKRTAGVNARRQILAGGAVSQDVLSGLSGRDRITTRRTNRGRDRRLDQRVQDDNLKEYLEGEKLLWLVIINEEQDKFIEGVQLADDRTNEVTFNAGDLDKSRKAYEEDIGGNFPGAGPSANNAAVRGYWQ